MTTTSPSDEIRRQQREQRLVDLAFAGILTSVQASMGRALPDDEAARELVRVGRVVYDEIDHPTVREEPTEDSFGPKEPESLFEELFEQQ